MGTPAVGDLGIDLVALDWQRSGEGDRVVEVAFARDSQERQWVLMRLTGDPDQRVLLYSAAEWREFVQCVRAGEFDLPA